MINYSELCTWIIIQAYNSEFDISNIEASRATANQKVEGDYLKLIIENKCVLDKIMQTIPDIKPENANVLFIQLCGNCINLIIRS